HSMQLVLSQRALEQTPALQTLTVGQVAEINCHKGTKTPSSAIRWYRQRDNEKLERIFTVKRPSPNAKYRENITDDEYRQVLVIKNVQRNDSGTYYCSGQNDSDRSLVFGNGSKIVIVRGLTSQTKRPGTRLLVDWRIALPGATISSKIKRILNWSLNPRLRAIGLPRVSHTMHSRYALRYVS
uniref:Ig-like domain-containing protein n=1 Tax=Callorhinchus milii TaxID=7868 RepID=A0A4W3H046_CALMI